MRAIGHRLTTAWNGARGKQAQSVGVCLCGDWAAAGKTRSDVRDLYEDHLVTAVEMAAEEAAKSSADFQNHHIEGYARAAQEAGKDGKFSAPLISQIRDNLWMGGCRDGVRLGDEFDHVVSLYPWEKYTLAPHTTRHEIKLYDAAEMPHEDQLFDAAMEINDALAEGKRVLVHCQAGLNRSGLITALSMIIDGMTPTEAIALLREKRCAMVLCNATFEQWLLAFDDEIAA